MALGISPTVDYAFKRLLGDPHHKRVLIHLLNAIFEKQFVVVDVDILNPFLEKDFEDDKLSVLDLRARDTCGRQYNLEMQTSVAGALTRRLVYYLACIYSQQLGESEKYERLAPAMSICFLDGILFRESPTFHTRFQLCSLEHQLVFSDQLEVHLIELPKYRGGAAVLPRARPVEKWAYFLGHVDQLEIPEIERLFQDPVFVEAGGILEMISKTEEERLRYELRMKALRDLHSNLDFAEMRGLETGRQQGLEEGRREGRHEGRQEGRLEGTIQTLQQLLGEPVTNSDELTTRDREQLEELAEVLQARMRGRLA
jgi:predicted transposase/invertase (TIGR01784 family)